MDVDPQEFETTRGTLYSMRSVPDRSEVMYLKYLESILCPVCTGKHAECDCYKNLCLAYER